MIMTWLWRKIGAIGKSPVPSFCMNKIQFPHPRHKCAPSLVSPAAVKSVEPKQVSMCTWWARPSSLDWNQRARVLGSTLPLTPGDLTKPFHLSEPMSSPVMWKHKAKWSLSSFPIKTPENHFFPQKPKILCNLTYAKHKPRSRNLHYVENMCDKFLKGVSYCPELVYGLKGAGSKFFW